MRYGIGQKVRVKDFKELIKEFGIEPNGKISVGNYYFTREMKIFCGERCRVVNVYGDGSYDLDLEGSQDWYFTDGMLEIDEPKSDELSEIKAENLKLKQEIEKYKKKLEKYESLNTNEETEDKIKRSYTRRK